MAARPNKTTATATSVTDYIADLPDAKRQEEAKAIDALMRAVTGCAPTMWGPSIIGYGSYFYRYESGREGVMCRAGFSPRKAALTLYSMGHALEGSAEAADLFTRLGKHERGKGCLYIRHLADVDLDVLAQLVALSWAGMKRHYPEDQPPAGAAAKRSR